MEKAQLFRSDFSDSVGCRASCWVMMMILRRIRIIAEGGFRVTVGKCECERSEKRRLECHVACGVTYNLVQTFKSAAPPSELRLVNR